MELTLKLTVCKLRTEAGARVDAVPCGRVAEEGGGGRLFFGGLLPSVKFYIYTVSAKRGGSVLLLLSNFEHGYFSEH